MKFTSFTIALLALSACTTNTNTEMADWVANMEVQGESYKIDMTKFYDLSIPIDSAGPRAWYLDGAEIEAVRDDNWVGVVAEGGSVNFRNIAFNPHGHGTHTEGPGHVEPTVHSIDRAVDSYHVLSLVITALPSKLENGDEVILWETIEKALGNHNVQAVILRTSTEDRRKKNWSNTNPPYLEAKAAEELRKRGVLHLLLDLPSVDREVDGGALLAHKAFWNIPENVRLNATITELIHVPSGVVDGKYLLNLQIAPFVNDAAPSRPLIYPLL